MKHYYKLLSAVSILGVLALSSCEKKIDEAYKNPNAPVEVQLKEVFPAMIGTMLGNGHSAANSYGTGGDIINVGRYIQYWNSYGSNSTENAGPAYDKMAGVSGSGTSNINIWSMFYWTHGTNLNKIIEWGTAQGKLDYVGAAWALRAWGMLEMTDEYGEGILRQAWDQTRITFDYNDQSEFYDSVRVIAKRAIAVLDQAATGSADFGAADFYFLKGDVSKWRKFACGVLARSFAYVHNKSTYSADSVIKYANMSCQVNADNCMLSFQNTGVTSTKNYFGTARANVNSATSTAGLRQSAFIANLMSGVNTLAFTGATDPRAWYMLRENDNNTIKGYSPVFNTNINPVLVAADQPRSFLGTLYGVGGGVTPEGGRYVFRDAAEFPVMTASEMKLIAAEAYLRKGMTTDSRNAYIDAISFNFDMLVDKYSTGIPAGREITPANKASYLANTAVVPATPAGMTLTRIMLQKYIALYGWGAMQTWADMRRYHYNLDLDPATSNPVYAGLIIPTTANTNLWTGPNGTGSNNGKPVQRVRPSYNSEYLYNIPALNSVGAYPPGNDYHTKEMWFSKP